METKEILLEKNADEPMHPASMSKIMTVYLAFEAIKKGYLKLDDTIPISEVAWRKGGSRMFLKLNSQIKVSDILRGIIVQSGNDAAIALAESGATAVAARAASAAALTPLGGTEARCTSPF